MTYVQNTEPPLNYHLWSGISVLCSSLKRNVFMKRSFTFYPNQYIILVGPPGVGKGEAIKPAVSIAKKADTANYLSDRWTAERIVQKLANGFSKPGFSTVGGVAKGVIVQDASATIVSTELPVFLGASDWMLPFLCEMWDKNEFEYETKHGTSSKVSDLCTSLVAGCVPDFIRKINKDSGGIITGGFTSRCIFAYADKPAKEIAWSQPLEGTQLEQDLIDDLRHISLLNGEMKFHPRAYTKYEAFYHSCMMNGKFEQAVVAHFKGRARTHVLKTAIALCVSETDNLVIEETHLEQAIQMIVQVQNDLERVFRFVGANKELEAIENIMMFLEHKGMASFDEVMLYNYRYLSEMSEEGLQRLLSVMCTMKFCKYENSMYKVVPKTKGASIRP